MFDRIKKVLDIRNVVSIFVVPFFVAPVTVVVVLLLGYDIVIKFTNNVFFQK